MPEPVSCDFCGGTEGDLHAGAALYPLPDGLWACGKCRPRLRTGAVPAAEEETIPDELRALVGQSAGALCRGWPQSHSLARLAFDPGYQTIIEAASAIAYDEDRYMSAWNFVTLWLDGTTVWRSPDGRIAAQRAPSGSISFGS